MAVKIFLNGCNGRMGRMFTRIAAKYNDVAIVAGADVVEAADGDLAAPPSYPVYIIPAGAAGGAGIFADRLKNTAFDIIVDFSHPSGLTFVLNTAIDHAVPAILATTGHSDAQLTEIADAAKKIPVFKTPNMSVGINLMTELIKTAAAVLADGFDIELIEAHHNQKLDAPSGTALVLADAMNEVLSGEREYVYDRHNIRAKRGKKEIGIHTIRGGTLVGEHSVIFAGTDEVLEIKHTATSREIFAEGAVRAVRFMTEKRREPGLYNMRDAITVGK